uniref:Uncharacterized protein n=1 Tax=Rhizophora mucronata TaxID=61149 RepID=A0A2P2NU83_RHIMU
MRWFLLDTLELYTSDASFIFHPSECNIRCHYVPFFSSTSM